MLVSTATSTVRTERWRMPAETARQDRLWLSFPRENETLHLGGGPETGYAVWAQVANAAARFQPVTVLTDPSEKHRARRMLDSSIELIETPLDDFWLRDNGASFVQDAAGRLGAVDWVFTGWGSANPEDFARDNQVAALMAERTGAEHIPSLLGNEGGGFHVDGAGTVLVTETVQLDPRRNPLADKRRVEAELARTIGATSVVWLSQGLTADYEPIGTRGHVDIVATMPRPGVVLLHQQRDAGHPDFAVSQKIRRELELARDAAGNRFEIVELPAPATLKAGHGWVDWSYVNHVVINDAVIACGFGEPAADARAAGILGEYYPGRNIVTIDAREIFARGGGIHCITQQQPAAPAPEPLTGANSARVA